MLFKNNNNMLTLCGRFVKKEGNNYIIEDYWGDNTSIEYKDGSTRFNEMLTPGTPMIFFCHLDEQGELISNYCRAWSGLCEVGSKVVVFGKVCDNQSNGFSVVPLRDGSMIHRLCFTVRYGTNGESRFADCVAWSNTADEFSSSVHPGSSVAVYGYFVEKNNKKTLRVLNLESFDENIYGKRFA